jgi:small subunit ribosomal protein S4
MARYTDAKCRLCRREGAKLFLKGARCATEKCAFTKRTTPPGVHTRPMGKQSYYAMQLREKQKVKRLYGMLERQFRRFFQVACKATGSTGKKLIELLERRLDNVVYRALFASSRTQARQIVGHGLLFLNNRRNGIPSAWVKEGDVLQLRCTDKQTALLKDAMNSAAKERSIPGWLEVDKDKLQIKVLRLPAREDVLMQINEQLIVELYSK